MRRAIIGTSEVPEVPLRDNLDRTSGTRRTKTLKEVEENPFAFV